MDNTILKPGLPVALCSDHAGYPVKEAVKQWLDAQGIAYKDFGISSSEKITEVQVNISANKNIGKYVGQFGTSTTDSANGATTNPT